MKTIDNYEKIKTKDFLDIYQRMNYEDFEMVLKSFNMPGCVLASDSIYVTFPRYVRILYSLNKMFCKKLKTGGCFGLKTVTVTVKKAGDVDLPILVPYEKGDKVKVWRVHKGKLATIIAVQAIDEKGEPEETHFLRYPNFMI